MEQQMERVWSRGCRDAVHPEIPLKLEDWADSHQQRYGRRGDTAGHLLDGGAEEDLRRDAEEVYMG